MANVHIRKKVLNTLLITALLAVFMPAGNLTAWAETDSFIGNEVDSVIRIEESNSSTFDTDSADVPGFSDGRFYANGTEIILRDNNGILSAYDAASGQLVSGDEDLAGVIIYAGWENGSHNSGTSIILESGTHTSSIYGDSREGILEGDVNIEVNGGEWSTLYGGSAYAEITGDVHITVNDGNPYFIYGGGYEARQNGDVNIEINGGWYYKEYYDGYDDKYYKSYGWIYGGGYFASDVINGNTNITVTNINSIADNQIGHIAGGEFYGSVTGNVNIVVEGGIYNQIYGGGGSAEAKVGGDVNLSISNAEVLYSVYGAGYGSVDGTVAIDLYDNITVGVTSGQTGDIYGGAKYSADPVQVGGVVINIWGSNINLVGVRQRGVYGGGQCGTVGTVEINVYGDVIYNGGDSAPVHGGGHSTRGEHGSSEVTGSAVVNVYSVTYDNAKASEQGRVDGNGAVNVGAGSEVNYLHYRINGTPGLWEDGEITLDTNGDALTIFAVDGPTSPTKISVEAPDNAAVTVKGKEDAAYENLSITVKDSDNITLTLEDLDIHAGTAGTSQVDAEHGILYNGVDGHSLTVEIVGNCKVKGSNNNDTVLQTGNGIFNGYGENNLVLSGIGVLIAEGGDGTRPNRNTGGRGIASNHIDSTLYINVETYSYSGSVDQSVEESGNNGDSMYISGNLVVNSPLYTEGWDNFRTDGGYGYRGITVVGNTVINADVTAVGGNGYRGGTGAFFQGDLKINNAKLTAAGGDGTYLNGGEGLQLGFNSDRTYTISGTGTVVEAVGGDGNTAGVSGFNYLAGKGIHIMSNTSIKISDGAVVTAVGGSSTGTQGTAGAGIYSGGGTYGGDIEISDATVTAIGGDGDNGPYGGIFAWFGAITIKNGADVKAIGGDRTVGSGSVGLWAYGDGSGNTVTIAPDTGNLYIRGGNGPSGQQASIIGDNIYVASGNVGEIAFQSNATGKELKNAANGDDIYMITVYTDPPAPNLTVFSDVTGGLASNYRYNAPADSDGTTYMWLPELELAIQGAGYTTERVFITDDNQVQVTLYATSVAVPQVASVRPSGTGAPRSGNITIIFDVDMDTDYHGTAALDPGSTLKEGNWLDNHTYVIPYSGLLSGTHYTVEIADFKDEYGTAMLPDITHSFTTESASGSSSSGGTNTYTIRFDSNGGSLVSSQSIIRNGKAVEPEVPVRDGYTFTGWYTDEELTIKYDFDMAVSAGFTLYAGWETVTDGSGGGEDYDHPAYISGYPDVLGDTGGTFRPDGILTRAEAATMFFNLLGSDITAGSYTVEFEDISSNSWYYDAVMELARRGVINGYRDETFKADAAITRAEFVTMALRFANVTEGGEADFPDVTRTNWASAAISAAVDAGYVSGYPDGTFQPDRTVTRAEAVTIINRIIECEGISGGSIFSDVPNSHWAYKAINAAAVGHNH